MPTVQVVIGSNPTALLVDASDSQDVQVIVPIASANVPFGHSSHEIAPPVNEKVPFAQSLHSIEPSRSVNFPGSQGEHDVCPGMLENDPGSHALQEVVTTSTLRHLCSPFFLYV